MIGPTRHQKFSSVEKNLPLLVLSRLRAGKRKRNLKYMLLNNKQRQVVAKVTELKLMTSETSLVETVAG